MASNATGEVSFDTCIEAMKAYASQFRYIRTTCGKEILFDDGDYDVLRKQKVFYDNRRNIVMCVWVSKSGKKTAAPVAKMMMDIVGKSSIKYLNGNSLDLRRANLEEITHQQSQFKKKKQDTENETTSQYKGVTWSKFAEKWAAHIKFDYKKIHLGYFTEEVQAAKAYNDKAIELFGKEYSLLNVIPVNN
jgi:hypothetical protein